MSPISDTSAIRRLVGEPFTRVPTLKSRAVLYDIIEARLFSRLRRIRHLD
jgi:hypothetical protein